jgi:uncharacterized zinc-type alcohol dehydrogenase-like protein
MVKARGYAAHSATETLRPFTFERRALLPHDVHIKVQYCGVCHSDIHTARNEWHSSVYPVVPGHEIVGQVLAVGDSVNAFKAGDLVAVGCLVDSCQDCSSCHDHCEQYCENGGVWTYNSPDKVSGGVTYGGYSDSIVVNDKFVLHLPANLDVKAAAPLLCAGITTYSPLKHWNVGKGDYVGVVGLGGLGHMAVKLAKAMGAHVTVITTSPSKIEDAKKLGATDVLLSSDKKMMEQHANRYRVIINTIPQTHDVNPYLTLLKRDGVMVIVGAVEAFKTGMDGRLLIFNRRSLAGSLVGGIKETQELLEFCAKHQILPEVEMIPMHKINEAYERMLKNDVKYRFVIDMASLSE